MDDEDEVVPDPPPTLSSRELDRASPRHRAARVLVRCMAVSWLILVSTAMLGPYVGQGRLTETSTQLMLTIGSALVAATAAYLVRRVTRPPDPALENTVGWWLSVTLGGMLLILAVGPPLHMLVKAVQGEPIEPLGTNALNLMSVIFGGAIGALGSYLGLRVERDDDYDPPPTGDVVDQDESPSEE